MLWRTSTTRPESRQSPDWLPYVTGSLTHAIQSTPQIPTSTNMFRKVKYTTQLVVHVKPQKKPAPPQSHPLVLTSASPPPPSAHAENLSTLLGRCQAKNSFFQNLPDPNWVLLVNGAGFAPKPPDDWAKALKPMALAGAAKEGALEGAKAVALPGANTPATEGEPTPEVCLNAGVLTPIPEVCPNAGALTPIPEVCPTAGVLTPPIPDVCLNAGVPTPIPEVCPNAGVLTPIPDVCPNAGVLTPIPEVCPNAGVLTPPIPDVCLNAGVPTPIPEVCPNAGALTPNPEVCPNAGALTPIPEVCPYAGVLTPIADACTNAVREPLVGVAGAPNNAHPDADGAVPNNANPQPLAGTPEFWYAFDVFAAKFWVKLDDADGAPRELNAGAPPIAIASSAKSGPDAVPAGAATTSPPIMARTSAPEGAAAGTPPANRRVPSGASQVSPPAALVAGVLDDAVSSVRARITSSKRESPGSFPFAAFESFAAFSASLPFFVFAVLSAPALRSARTISP